MRYLLDTNVCVDYLTGRYPSVAARLRALGPSDVCLSSVVVAELRYGADKSAHPRRNHRMLDALTDEIFCQAFDGAAAGSYGKVRSDLDRSRLVTDNVREFGRVRGLDLENWRGE